MSAVAVGGLTETKALTDVSSYGVTLAGDGSGVLYYNKTTGRFFKINSDGTQTPLTDKIFHQSYISNLMTFNDISKDNCFYIIL